MSDIDVCIPTYNRENLICELISTIPENWDICVSDNGSFLSKSGVSFSRKVKISSSERVVDVFENWKNAASLGSNDWFFIPSDDDKYLPNSFEIVTDAIKDNPSVGMIVFGHHVIDEKGEVIDSWVPRTKKLVSSKDAFANFSSGVPARTPSVLIRRRAYNTSGGISTDFKLTAGDSELIQRLAIQHPVLFIPTIISGYRIWPGGLTHRKQATKEWSDEIEIWMKMLDFELWSTDWGSSKWFRRRIQDEIRLQNIYQGVLRLKTWAERMAFLKLKPYPLFASPKTQTKFAMALFRTMVRP